MLRGVVIVLYNFLRRRSGEGGARLFSLVAGGQICETGSRLHQGRLSVDISKISFTVRIIKCWNRYSKGLVDAPCMSLFQGYLDNILHLLVSPEVVIQLDFMISVGPFKLDYYVLIIMFISLISVLSISIFNIETAFCSLKYIIYCNLMHNTEL